MVWQPGLCHDYWAHQALRKNEIFAIEERFGVLLGTISVVAVVACEKIKWSHTLLSN